MALLRAVLKKNVGEALSFPVEFSKLATDSTTNKLVFSVGHLAITDDTLKLKFPKSRRVTKVEVHKAADEMGHWHLVFYAEKTETHKPTAPDVKLVKIDLTQTAYRVIHNALPKPSFTSVTYTFTSSTMTMEDVYRHLFIVAREKGPWKEKGYNCQEFVKVLIARLGVLEQKN
jgi:hypothetical protein